MTPPQITDAEGWPFQMLSPVPYRPDSFDDWRAGILEALGLKDGVPGVAYPFHDRGISK